MKDKKKCCLNCDKLTRCVWLQLLDSRGGNKTWLKDKRHCNLHTFLEGEPTVENIKGMWAKHKITGAEGPIYKPSKAYFAMLGFDNVKWQGLEVMKIHCWVWDKKGKLC